MKPDVPSWIQRKFSIHVIVDGTTYYTTREPFLATAEAAQKAMSETVGMIDEKAMLYPMGGYKVPALRLYMRYTSPCFREEQVLVPAHILSRSAVKVLLEEKT